MKLLHTSGPKEHCHISVIPLFSGEMGLTSTMVIPLPGSRAKNSWTLLTVSGSLMVRILPGQSRRGWNSKLKVKCSGRAFLQKSKSKYLGNKSKQKKKSQSKRWVHAKKKGRKGKSKEEIEMLEYLSHWWQFQWRTANRHHPFLLKFRFYLQPPVCALKKMVWKCKEGCSARTTPKNFLKTKPNQIWNCRSSV